MNASALMSNSSVTSARPSLAAVFGDVTALALADIPISNAESIQIVLGGIGSQLHAFSLPDCRHLCSQTVLPNAVRCHGIATCSSPYSTLVNPSLWIAVHGDRHVNILSFSPSNLTTFTQVAAIPRLIGWTMAVKIFPLPGSLDALVTVGLSNNSVEFYKIRNGEESAANIQRVQRVECADQCLLYSIDLFFPSQRTENNGTASFIGLDNDHVKREPLSIDDSKINPPGMCLVAGGTIFLDVIIWAATWQSISSSGSDIENDRTDINNGSTVAIAPVLYRLKGHEGSIHTVQWGPFGLTLASGSDDLTLRLWDIPIAEIMENTGLLQGGGSSNGTASENEEGTAGSFCYLSIF